jgi:hypothetical protein
MLGRSTITMPASAFMQGARVGAFAPRCVTFDRGTGLQTAETIRWVSGSSNPQKM